MHVKSPEDRRPVPYRGAEALNPVCGWAAVHREGTRHCSIFLDFTETNEVSHGTLLQKVPCTPQGHCPLGTGANSRGPNNQAANPPFPPLEHNEESPSTRSRLCPSPQNARKHFIRKKPKLSKKCLRVGEGSENNDRNWATKFSKQFSKK